MTRHLTERLIRLSLLAYFASASAALVLAVVRLKPLWIALAKTVPLILAAVFGWLEGSAAFGILILPVALAACWISRVRRARTSTCLTCGYDVRATPERCPECGCPPWHRP